MKGSIRQTSADRWQVRVSTGRDPETGRYHYVHRQVEGTKRTAQRAAAELVAEVSRGYHLHSGTYSVADLLERWMTHITAQGRAPSTLARYRSAIRADIVPRLGTARIDTLASSDIDRFYASLARAGLKPLSVRKCHAILSASLNQAVKWGWIDRNPVNRASPPGVRQKEIVPPTLDEAARLLAECERSSSDLGSLIYVALTTGCRRGELCGLRWGDADLDEGTLVVARSISDAAGEVAVKGTKTHQVRRIALDPGTVSVLRRHRAHVEQRAGASIGPSSYVWSQDVAARLPYRPDRVTGAFRLLRERLDLGHISFHALRHFVATTLAGQGVGVRTIAGRLGHANPGVTLRTYAHFLESADREAATVIGHVVAALVPTAEPDSR